MKKFNAVIQKTEEGDYEGYIPDLGVFAVGKPSREAVLESLQDGLALHILALQEAGQSIPKQKTLRAADEDTNAEVVQIEPTPINPVSLELEAALKSAGITQAELARRMGVSRVVVNRILDPLAPDHKVSTLKRVAEALDKRLEVVLQ